MAEHVQMGAAADGHLGDEGRQVLRGAAGVFAEPAPKWRVSVLRYFNPIGGHPSGPGAGIRLRLGVYSAATT